MKKAVLNLLALVLACSVLALAQDTMKHDEMGKSDNAKKADTSKEAAPKLMTLRGWVSDEKCGAKNASAKGAACAKGCIEKGEKVVFVNDKDKKVWNVKNPEDLKGHEGHHVKLSAHVYDDGSIHVMSVSMLGKKKAASTTAS
jgi:hypothetical protein